VLSHVFGAVDKTSSLVFAAHGKIGNFIIFTVVIMCVLLLRPANNVVIIAVVRVPSKEIHYPKLKLKMSPNPEPNLNPNLIPNPDHKM